MQAALPNNTDCDMKWNTLRGEDAGFAAALRALDGHLRVGNWSALLQLAEQE